jgi:hypothetical protein
MKETSIPDDKPQKPAHVKPAFYAFVYLQLKEIAREYGYNLLLNGSMARDLDLIAVPWVDEPKDAFEMIQAFAMAINGIKPADQDTAMFSILPGGRKSYVININRGAHHNMYLDEEWYVDISITPRIGEHKLYPVEIINKVERELYRRHNGMFCDKDGSRIEFPYQVMEIVRAALAAQN